MAIEGRSETKRGGKIRLGMVGGGEAEFYSRAAYGHGLAPSLLGPNPGPVTGGPHLARTMRRSDDIGGTLGAIG